MSSKYIHIHYYHEMYNYYMNHQKENVFILVKKKKNNNFSARLQQ